MAVQSKEGSANNTYAIRFDYGTDLITVSHDAVNGQMWLALLMIIILNRMNGYVAVTN